MKKSAFNVAGNLVMGVKFTFQSVFGNSLQNPRHFSARGREESLELYSILWSDWPTSKQEVLRHGNRFVARVRRRYFLEGEKRRPEMRLRFAGYSLRKQTTFRDISSDFPVKGHLRNKCRNSILMMHHYPDLASASDWSCCMWNLPQPIISTTQIWVVACYQYGISALVSQTLFHDETVGDVAKRCLFSQAMLSSPLIFLKW